MEEDPAEDLLTEGGERVPGKDQISLHPDRTHGPALRPTAPGAWDVTQVGWECWVLLSPLKNVYTKPVYFPH